MEGAGKVKTQETKSAAIRRHMAADQWRQAVALAARLPRLDKHRTAILDAHNAFVRPEWAKSLGKCPNQLIAAGTMALKERFPL